MKSVTIGTDGKTKAPVSIDEQARGRSTYMLGIQGTGKSTVLEQIAYQDMADGDGLIFLDPHGDSAQRLLERVPAARAGDVIFWDPADREHPIGINPFYCPNPDDYDSRANAFIAALASVAEFAEVFQSAPRMKDILEHLAIAFVVNQGHTLIEMPTFLTDGAFREHFYRALEAEYPQVRRFWEEFDAKPAKEQRVLTESSLNKLRRFGIHRTMRAIFGEAKPKVRMREAMDRGAVIIVTLNRSRLGPENAALFGAFLIFDLLA
jgi:hypothetical protein